jgi:2-oxo-4-hydroxy-4-carboxy-5-ureidoimidazoline decarboxylase
LADQDAQRLAFIQRYGGIYEHSPWVAEQAYEEAAGIDDPDQLAKIFARHVDAAGHGRKLALIRAHPDLAEKTAIGARHTSDLRGLTEASRAEQSSAGLDQCSSEEYAKFRELNDRYRKKFGFPFIMAVRGSKRREILAAFERRLQNDAGTEFDTAIAEIHKIARLRLQADAR